MPLHELNKGQYKVLLAGLADRSQGSKGEDLFFDVEESMEELKRLAETLGFIPLNAVVQDRISPDPRTYFGKGKVSDLLAMIEESGAEALLVNGILSPIQAKNLEEALGVPVMDRPQVILRIFAQRARSKEGKIQVQLASLQYQLTRMVGRGKEMSNQGGGIGTRGPGETKLEEDRRLVKERIGRLQAQLAKIASIREGQRKKRLASSLPRVSLVGYTNAGKSTLFNALTGEDVLCDDKLFATLDPWVRRWHLPSGQVMLLTDTVGFIQGLPHDLVAAFQSTLEESLDADILVHVVDVSSRVFADEIRVVEKVLTDLGANSIPRITCFNKVDRVQGVDIGSLVDRFAPSVAISALNRTGLDDLTAAIQRVLDETQSTASFVIPYSLYSMVHEIREVGTIIKEDHGQEGTTVTCRLSHEDKERFEKRLAVGMKN